MLSNLSIHAALNLNGKTNRNGLRTIVIVIYQSGTKLRTTINTKICVREEDFKFGKVQKSDENYDLINRKIKRRIRKLMEFEDEMEEKNIEITPKKLKEYYKNNLTASATVSEWVESVIVPSINRKESTKNSYKCLAKVIEEFNKGTTIRDLTYDFLERFTQWMKNVKKLKHNTITGRMKALRCLCNEAIKRNILKSDDDPFKNYTIKEMIPRHEYLTESELKRLEKLKLDDDKHLSHIRDAFLFCCYTGMRFSDFKSLESYNYNPKNMKLSFKQGKTGSLVELPLKKLFGGKPVKIMRKYRSIEAFAKIGHNSTVNKKLKEIGKRANIKVDLHFHLARHTCGTLLNAKGMQMQEIQRILGHARMDTTSRIYAVTAYKQLSNSLGKAFKNVLDEDDDFEDVEDVVQETAEKSTDETKNDVSKTEISSDDKGSMA